METDNEDSWKLWKLIMKIHYETDEDSLQKLIMKIHYRN